MHTLPPNQSMVGHAGGWTLASGPKCRGFTTVHQVFKQFPGSFRAILSATSPPKTSFYWEYSTCWEELVTEVAESMLVFCVMLLWISIIPFFVCSLELRVALRIGFTHPWWEWPYPRQQTFPLTIPWWEIDIGMPFFGESPQQHVSLVVFSQGYIQFWMSTLGYAAAGWEVGYWLTGHVIRWANSLLLLWQNYLL